MVFDDRFALLGLLLDVKDTLDINYNNTEKKENEENNQNSRFGGTLEVLADCIQ